MDMFTILSDLDKAEEELREANRLVMEAKENKKVLEEEIIRDYISDPEFRRYLKIDVAKLRREQYMDKTVK